MTSTPRKDNSTVTADARTGGRSTAVGGWIIAAYALIGAAFVALLLLVPSSARGIIPDPTGPTAVMPAAPASPSPAVAGPRSTSSTEPFLAQGSTPLNITYPAVGMDQDVLPLGPEEEGSGAIVPPLTLEAYWLTSYGRPGRGSTNTTYIVGHSWEDRGSAFNNLSVQATPGDPLTLTTTEGTLTYTVNEITTENKDTLKNSRIWAKVPGRLVLISCYTADLWGKNIVITATPVAAREYRSAPVPLAR